MGSLVTNYFVPTSELINERLEIYSISQEIKKISNEIKICRDIEDRKEIVKDNLKETEMVIDEYVK